MAAHGLTLILHWMLLYLVVRPAMTFTSHMTIHKLRQQL